MLGSYSVTLAHSQRVRHCVYEQFNLRHLHVDTSFYSHVYINIASTSGCYITIIYVASYIIPLWLDCYSLFGHMWLTKTLATMHSIHNKLQLILD